jgi:hypothetical protein
MIPKPLPTKIPWRQKGKRPLTIAIGMLCAEGAIIAADTRIVMTDGTTREGTKISQVIAKTGVYVIANATSDGNAANTLIPDLLTDLQKDDPKSFAQAEKVMRRSMTEWAKQYPHGIPSIEIILAVNINREQQSDIRSGGGIRLYHCEPPNTMVPIDRNNSSAGYIAIGGGASITDPIFRTLFSTLCTANGGLQQIAYLMYRAKKDAASICGGSTEALLLKSEFGEPLWVESVHMETAEMYGEIFDFCLHMTACGVLAESDEAAEKLGDILKLNFTNHGRLFRSHRFLTDFGEDVGLPPPIIT